MKKKPMTRPRAWATWENPKTDPSLTPAERARQAFSCARSCDWNEETGEHNPYPKGGVEYHEYNRVLEATTEAFTAAYPHA